MIEGVSTQQDILLVRVSSVLDKCDHPQFFDPCYPLKTIQAILEQRKGGRVCIRDCWVQPGSEEELVELTRGFKPGLVVVSASSFDIHAANKFVAGIKKLDFSPVVVGIGQGMYLNREMRDGKDELYDAILLGEPEEEFLVLLEQINSHSGLDAIWRKHYRQLYTAGTRLVVNNPDALPFSTYTNEEIKAHRSIFPIRKGLRVKWGYLIAGRGCPHACSFCGEVMRVSVGTKLRLRSGKSVADEMEHLARHGVNIISFQDDSFASSPKLVREVCGELIRRQSVIPWMARVRCDEVDYNMLSLMKNAGCVILGIGVETGTQRIIEQIHKTHAPKPWAELARQTFLWTRELGIGTNAYYVIGNPTETPGEMEETIKLALELDSDSIQVHFHTPYPGSPDWDKYRDIIADHDPTEMFHYSRPQFTLANVSVDKLMNIRARFYRRYLFRPGFILRHLWHYGIFYLLNPNILWTLLGIRKVIWGRK